MCCARRWCSYACRCLLYAYVWYYLSYWYMRVFHGIMFADLLFYCCVLYICIYMWVYNSKYTTNHTSQFLVMFKNERKTFENIEKHKMTETNVSIKIYLCRFTTKFHVFYSIFRRIWFVHLLQYFQSSKKYTDSYFI